MNAFFNLQFSYCPLIWMRHSRSIIEKCLRMIYVDKKLSFEELLHKCSSVSIHDRNIQNLVTELDKTIKSISPNHMSEIFKLRINRVIMSGRILSFCELWFIRFSMVLKTWHILVQNFRAWSQRPPKILTVFFNSKK